MRVRAVVELRDGVIVAYVNRMIRSLGSLLVLGMVGFGCGVGGGSSRAPDAPEDVPIIPPQDTNDQSITCTAQITLTGTFTAAAMLDPAGGCQPIGTWAVTATVSDKGNCTTVKVKDAYTYTLTGGGHDTKVAYDAKESGEEFQGNVNATGSGACSGAFEHILADGSSFDQIALHPLIPKPTDAVTELEISGSGEFMQWSRHP
jgi:hypothetical protein